jgi:amino acid transporter
MSSTGSDPVPAASAPGPSAVQGDAAGSAGSNRIWVAKTSLRAGALRMPDAVMQGVTTIAPAVAILFTLQFTASYAGIATPFAYVAALIIMLLLAGSAGQLARHLPSSSGFYTYISRATNARFGFLTSWVYFLALPLGGVWVDVNLGGVVHAELASAYGIDFPWWGFFLLSVAVAAVVVYRGIRLSARLLMIFGLIEMAIVVALAISGLVSPGAGGVSLRAFDPAAAPSFHGLFLGVVFSIFALTGWDGVAPLAEETENPRRNVPRGLVYSVLGVGLFCAVSSFGLVAGWGTRNITALAGSQTLAGFVLAHRFWAGLWWLVLLALANSAFATTLATMNAANRMWFGMSRSGVLPEVFGRLHEKTRVPIFSFRLQLVLMLTAGLALGSSIGTANTYAVTGLVYTLGSATIYVAGSLAVIPFYAGAMRREFNIAKHVLMPIAAAAATIFVVYKSFVPLPTGDSAWALPVFGIWIVLGILLLLGFRLRGQEEWLHKAGVPVEERLETLQELEHRPLM